MHCLQFLRAVYMMCLVISYIVQFPWRRERSTLIGIVQKEGSNQKILVACSWLLVKFHSYAFKMEKACLYNLPDIMYFPFGKLQ